MGRALIIGHTGQDGSILWGQLADRGFALAGVSTSQIRLSDGSVAAASLDLNSPPALHELLASFAPTQIYYLAARHHSSQESISNVNHDWRQSWDVHVHAFQSLLEAVAVTCPDASVFYASSSRVFGKSREGVMDESAGVRPECIYGVTKAAGMLVANQYRRARGMRVSCGILFNHESPLRGETFVSQRIVRGVVAMMRGESTRLAFGDLDARVDWGYAPDYTRAMSLILEAEEPDDFVIATGSVHSVRDFVAAAAEYVGFDLRGRVYEDGALLKRASQGLAGNPRKLRLATGWQPSVGFKEMVGLLVDAELARVSTSES